MTPAEAPEEAEGAPGGEQATAPGAAPATEITRAVLGFRIFAGSIVLLTFDFLLNNHLTFWVGWPGVPDFLAHQQWLGHGPLRQPLERGAVVLGWLQFLSYPGCVLAAAVLAGLTRRRTLRDDSRLLGRLAAYIVRAAFWAVFLVGLADMLISFLRIEGFLAAWVGEEMTTQLGRPTYRGQFVHYPLILASLVIALLVRGLGFIWLGLLVVAAEFQIVISRFVFSYEQAFMGDLVRFWYAALFLFASAYALIEEGHVRVDVFYARFSQRGKAWTNALGSLFLGIPVCWVILTTGMWGKGSSLNSPLLSFEISQSGFGMYTKYMMAGFLVVFALSMAVQFMSYFLDAVADLRGDPGHREPGHDDLGLVPHR